VSQAVFLSPHNDDETLFGAFTILGDRPRVIVCFRSVVQAQQYGIPHAVREAETAEALRCLGLEGYEQWTISDAQPDWVRLHDQIAQIEASVIYAPLPEADGNAQHNRVGLMAAKLHGKGLYYATYTTKGKSREGRRVVFEPRWPWLKMKALACYQSQATLPSTYDHFLRDQYEYLK